MLRVGLTGGIGSGKTTVGTIFLHLGAGVVDADALAHELTTDTGGAIPEIRAEFGREVLTPSGALDRGKMRALAFVDATTRHRLEAILHPMIRRLAEERGRELMSAGAPYLMFVIPLLVESGDATSRFDRILVVDCSESTQLTRVCARPGIDRATAQRIVAAQAPRSARLQAASEVIFNEAPIDVVEQSVRRLHAKYLALAAECGFRESV